MLRLLLTFKFRNHTKRLCTFQAIFELEQTNSSTDIYTWPSIQTLPTTPINS